MRTTFFTDGRDVLDPTGTKVLLRGVNKMSVWDEADPTGDTYFAEIRKTQANSVRIVWAIRKDLKPKGDRTDLDTLDALITNARKHQLIPMIELHDGTGQWNRLSSLVDYWIQPKVVSLIQKHQHYLLINIGNEVGDDSISHGSFTSGYTTAVKRMRQAGIHTPLVIDGSDWGKNLDILNTTAGELILADPDKNLIFSVHTYWPVGDGADASFIQTKLHAAAAYGYPLIVGEFSKYGGFAGQDEKGIPRSICGEFGEVDYRTILRVCDEETIGWYAWEWGPGNDVDDRLCAVMDMTTDGSFGYLKTGWASDVVANIRQASESEDYYRLEPVPERSAVQIRIDTLKAFLTRQADQAAVGEALQEANGDWSKALATLTKDNGISEETRQRLGLAHSLAVWSQDHVPIVKALSEKPAVRSLRDVALHFDVDKLTALVDPKDVPANGNGSTAADRKKSFATALQDKLFTAEPTAVLQRMVRDGEVPIADTHHRAGVEAFLANQPDFNIRTTSIYHAMKTDDAFKGIADQHRTGVVEQLKTLQRVQAISPTPAAVPVLMKANLISAARVAEMPESTFMSAHGQTLGVETARQVYSSAINTHIRNEHALMTLREAWRGTGLAIIDGRQSISERMADRKAVADKLAPQLNLETLFGSADYCECDDCLSVYSPAAYFVDILQYLRNNDLGPDPKNPNKPNPGIRTNPKDISHTPLEKLFRRRPDLGCLDLTCANTFTVLPYIDLVNEVMESFVVHLGEYRGDTRNPKQATLGVFNVTDETTSELLAEPQHINYQAYCILKDAVYPFTLPYHQPIDAARTFLKSLGTTRYELLNTFRTSTTAVAAATLAPPQQEKLQALHASVLNRSADAEYLGLTQEEHIILTREAFWPKDYFDFALCTVHSQDDYEEKIGVRPVHEYYGYDTDADMVDVIEPSTAGLTLVKRQFLPRTGIDYLDVVELLKTRFINPAYPQGRALTVFERLRFSYRFLKTLVDPDTTLPRAVRFEKLLKFLDDPQALVPELEPLLHPEADPCKKTHRDCPEVDSQELREWVLCYFERVGKLIVLQSGEGPQLPVQGNIVADDFQAPTPIGTLRRDGLVLDPNGATIGHVTVSPVTLAGPIDWTDGKSFEEKFPEAAFLQIRDATTHDEIAAINSKGFLVDRSNDFFETLKWLVPNDTCDLEKVRLTHLDGSALTAAEYDRMQRFLRLWHKLGWTIAETDLALRGGAEADCPDIPKPYYGVTMLPGEVGSVGFEMFQPECADVEAPGEDVCGETTGSDYGTCPDVEKPADISVRFLHQLVAIRKVLQRTGLPLDKLLSFWAEINTAGKKSLYARLFLTHNLLGIDKVFTSDANGNYLTRGAKISEHLPVLMAAFKIKPDDVAAIIAFRQLPDALTLTTASAIYRHVLIAKTLNVAVADLPDVFALFGDPFRSADATLALLDDWRSMEDAGFTFRQLNYLVRDKDDSRRPLLPSSRTILEISKALYDGLNGIDQDHVDLPSNEKGRATADLIRAKGGLIYEASVVEHVINLLEGTSVYTTNAPVNQKIVIAESDSLAKKLAYVNQKDATPVSASIQVTGILTDAEKVRAKTLSSHTDWAKAVDRVGKQARQFFIDNLSGIFANSTEAMAILLAGDVDVPADPKDPAADAANTAPIKRYYFVQAFLPFLRRRLAHQLIVDQMSAAAGLPTEVTEVLLIDVLLVDASKQHAIDALEQIHLDPVTGATGWKGYLIPSADDAYTLVAKSLIGETQPPPVVVDGREVPFTNQQEDPSDVWSTDPATPLMLKSGKLYSLEVVGQPATNLQWKTASSPKASIPANALLPDYSSTGTKDVFVAFGKAALVVNGFEMTADEVSYLQTHGTDFEADSIAFDFNAITLGHWRRLHAYTSLRDSLPKAESTLLDLFTWAVKPGDVTKLTDRIVAVTHWTKADLQKLIALKHFDLDHPKYFRNEVNLVRLQHALGVANAVGTDITRLFGWANPASTFSVCHLIAEDIRATLRARYDQEDWEQVAKPVNDHLRESQKQALIGHLLVQQVLRDWGVVDADSLFEFFLIDVQMDACMETSRIKQAISSVQLFVQRCFLGLEDKEDGNGLQVGVPNDVLDRRRWDWMQRYRVWEANRKVFLYPENWLTPELRDDKSQFYKELESELLQKDINKQTVGDALKSYLFKVDEVANLKVVGLFREQAAGESGNLVDTTLHVFAQTRNAPYSFYYRRFNVVKSNWYSWEKMQVDIPMYDELVAGKITHVGSYLAPVVWNKRLLVFFPVFVSQATPVDDIKKPPLTFWEIRLAWSEYRNGKWTQKQVSDRPVYTKGLRSLEQYQFIPRIVTTPTNRLVIDVFETNTGSVGAFQFVGSQLSVTGVLGQPLAITHFHYDIQQGKPVIYSLQAAEAAVPPNFKHEPFFTEDLTSVTFNEAKTPFFHPFSHQLLESVAAGNTDDLFDYYRNKIANTKEAFGAFVGRDGKSGYNELKAPYSIYNWEGAFHAPMLLVDRLLKAQQFEQALAMCHYVLNPYAKGTGTDDDKRFWQFLPFNELKAQNVLENLFSELQPNQPSGFINEWRDNPFEPHVIARSRPSAYMKWVAMKYIEILIAFGDHHFRQNTLEAIPLAIQCYVLASHVYGPRGQEIPTRGKTVPQTYNSLLDKWDAFSNALVELELMFPFSNQTSLPIGESNGVVGLANVFGFASTLYFCIPDNPQLRALRDTIDDRLFKIRHCQDIDGVVRHLPLFEPPIDPALLVQATAQGLSLSSVLNDLNSPMPNYRFAYLLQKALELCAELKSLGSAFLSTKEKRDAEALGQLRARHEHTILTLTMDVKELQLDEAGKALDALQQSRKGPAYRLRHFLALVGEDAGRVPGIAAEFAEVPEQIERPLDEGGLKLTAFEKEEMDKATEANDRQEDVGRTEVLASIFHAVPNLTFPIGPGVSSTLGGSNAGAATQAVARANQVVVGNRSFSSTNAGRKAGYLRQLQDRVQQANVAGHEIKSIDKQILTQQIRIDVARREIANQQKQIDHAQEMEDFLNSKYTNQDLYSWMDGQIRTLYHQAYNLAYDLGKRAEKVFRFERGLTTSNFILYGYWDAAYDGLMAGERLYVGLKQLEAAHQEKRAHDFEVSKSMSLRQINPLALIQLKETGTCEFTLPEVLFDMDYPGHYLRRVKSVSLRIPCILGPHTSLNCTLRLLEHKFRTSAIAAKNDYPEQTDRTDERFSTVNVPISSIAVSSLDHENGVFEVNFHDERYLPFEGAGVISKWRLELPDGFRQFDYDTISDVVMRVSYTSLDGGDKLKAPAAGSVQDYIKSAEELSREEGLFAVFDLRNDFPNEWYSAHHPAAGATERVLTIGKLSDKLPIFTKGRPSEKILAKDISLFVSGSVTAPSISAKQGGVEITLRPGEEMGTMRKFVADDGADVPMGDLQINIPDATTVTDRIWLLERYVLVGDPGR